MFQSEITIANTQLFKQHISKCLFLSQSKDELGLISLRTDYHSPWNKCAVEVQIRSSQIEDSRVFLIEEASDS